MKVCVVQTWDLMHVDILMHFDILHVMSMNTPFSTHLHNLYMETANVFTNVDIFPILQVTL